MNENNDVLTYAKQLESILRKYLGCGYGDFGVKANDNLATYDWQSPINFALGHRYASLKNNPKVKSAIGYFLGNQLKGQHIGDIVERYKYFGYNSIDEAYAYVKETIEYLEEILFTNERF